MFEEFFGRSVDVFEELLGDFEDEYDVKDEIIHTKKDGSYIINTSISIAKFNEQFDISRPLVIPNTISRAFFISNLP